ncbi:uncharacterized protein LOC120718871 [Simochromis diagramma]|uniref:uncharacterized protein LOC120718871 n=1 Tax=Simochromis diagramma TaxID=43689 RepID=UPI001A7ED36F|nr:uncharacterized protein LOC120718871 [Simochromis diagramma]
METKLPQHSPTIDSYPKIFTPGSDVHFRPSLKPVATPHIQTQTTPIIANLKDHFPGKADQSETYTPKQEPTVNYARQPLDSGYTGAAYITTPDNSSHPHETTCRERGPLYTPLEMEQNMSDLVRFMARRELVTTGLLHFNDRPECYRAWKASFMNAIRGLNLSPSEQLDLLVKWLGKDSAEHARRIRSVYANQPANGLRAMWDRLNECYGAPEVIEGAFLKRLDNFPKIPNRDGRKLRELGDLLSEVQAAKEDGDLLGLSYLDTPRGVTPVVQKLPFYLQEKWLSLGFKYKEDRGAPYPPFGFFVDFVCREARMRNDPGLTQTAYGSELLGGKQSSKAEGHKAVAVFKTRVLLDPRPLFNGTRTTSFRTQSGSESSTRDDPAERCPLHNKPHPLPRCRGFREKPMEERKALLKRYGICYRCCRATHLARNCEDDISCSECGSKSHIAALHPGSAPWSTNTAHSAPDQGGEGNSNLNEGDVSTACTEVCGNYSAGRSCSKICLTRVYPTDCPEAAVTVYTILDEQSNRSLARTEFFDLFNIAGPPSPYTLKTCAGTQETEGRQARGFVIEPINGSVTLSLPSLIECNEIPNNRAEIPTPEVALNHSHLKALAKHIPKLDSQASILLLLGRDIIRVHKVRRQVNGPQNAPYAQKLDLGWVIVGDVCIGDVHRPTVISSCYTNVLKNGRPSLFQPCPNQYYVKEKYSSGSSPSFPLTCKHLPASEKWATLDCNVFQTTKDDDKEAPSIEDGQFIHIMEQEVYKDQENRWVAPLPFRSPRPRLPHNHEQALERLKSLQRSFRRKPKMKEEFVSFMAKIFQNGHAEEAPPLKPNEEHWYLPCFGVYHPKKPSQIRVVFDSSAQHKGLSLNQVLLTGPDLNNTLVGVLLRFRKEQIAFTVDVQQMFHCFKVRPEDRNFLRFLWFKENNPGKEIMEFRMNVHVFGNSPSPAVAIYCLRRAAQEGRKEYGEDAEQFVTRDFYVDDGLKSLPTADAAIDLLKRTQKMLARSNLRLHKLASNSKEVMKAFPSEDHATDLKDLDLTADTLPMQRSLGLYWDLDSDCFTYRVQDERKAFTQRGVLSTVNSLYDPLGFVSPVTIQGKLLLRELASQSSDWDTPLPAEKEKVWESWRDSLQELRHLRIPRPYSNMSPSTVKLTELCVFSDASEKAVAAVAYLKTVDADGGCCTRLVASKAKLAPRPEHTIPRLELCAAVMAVTLSEAITSEIDIVFDAVTYYTDSKVVLGYIYNEKRRFYVYVSNRVQRIRRSTMPQQWRYVCTEDNPADIATRSITADRLENTIWFSGPAFLSRPEGVSPVVQRFDLLEPDQDSKIRPQVTTLSVTVFKHLGSGRFNRFSCWSSLIRALGTLIHIVQSFKRGKKCVAQKCEGWHQCSTPPTGDILEQSKLVIIKTVQQEVYRKELECLASNANIPKSSSLVALDPFIDSEGLLRIGGRLIEAKIGFHEKRPLVLPGRHHVTTLIVRHFHEQVRHQGRLFTEGAVRSAGYWIVGGRRCINRLVFECVTCRRLRGRCEVQKMADLPPDRLSMEPPFSNVGIDVFGPWSVSARRTRGGHADSKRWAVLFTCLCVRAIHIEVIESLDSSSFINAFRRFMAIRGPLKNIRSDQGTNFTRACKDMGIPSNLDGKAMKRFLSEHGCTWTFNTPHSSHMGGAWERMIGITRRILDSMLLQMGSSKLTHEVLTTFMAEVSAIVNSRPLVPVSNDPTDPFILTPASLLTQKVDPCPVPEGDFGHNDLLKQQWRRVQSLSNTFWDRWRKQYLSTLQCRTKWTSDRPNLKQGSVVLLKDSQCSRNDWPLGIIVDVYPSKDGRVRKVQVKVIKKEGPKLYVRPVNEMILLIPPDD